MGGTTTFLSASRHSTYGQAAVLTSLLLLLDTRRLIAHSVVPVVHAKYNMHPAAKPWGFGK